MAPKKTSKEDSSYKLIVDGVKSHTSKTNNRVYAEARCRIGVLPIVYSRLALSAARASDYKNYYLLFGLNQDQRESLIEQLAPHLVEVAALQFEKLTIEQAEGVLRQELEESSQAGQFKLQMQARVMRGESEWKLPVKGPDDMDLEKPYLADGSSGMATFLMELTKNTTTKKFGARFTLQAVKVSTFVPYEGKSPEERDSDFSDFDDIDSSY